MNPFTVLQMARIDAVPSQRNRQSRGRCFIRQAVTRSLNSVPSGYYLGLWSLTLGRNNAPMTKLRPKLKAQGVFIHTSAPPADRPSSRVIWNPQATRATNQNTRHTGKVAASVAATSKTRSHRRVRPNAANRQPHLSLSRAFPFDHEPENVAAAAPVPSGSIS